MQEEAIRQENEKILAYIAEGKSKKVFKRAKKNAKAAAATGSVDLEGNCAFTLGRVAHESGQYLEAIEAYNYALGKAMHTRDLKVAASIHVSMASVLLERSDGDRMHNLKQAVTNNTMALAMIDQTCQPREYARIQSNLGHAYAELTASFGQPFLNQARICFQKAVRSFENQGMITDARKAEEALQSITRFSL
jgi:tetratricopeptide (TPR) repeat protein